MNTPYRILVVDDNVDIHRSFRKLLRAREHGGDLNDMAADLFGREVLPTTPTSALPDYAVDSAYQGEEAFAALQQACRDDRPYSVAFMDIRMPPGWDGIETTRKLWTLDPELPVALCSAHTDYSWDQIVTQLGMSEKLLFLRKPLEPVTIRQVALSMARQREVHHELRQRLATLEHEVEQLMHPSDVPRRCPSCGSELSSRS